MGNINPNAKFRLICLALGLGTIALYSPAAGFDFLNYNDLDYVAENYRINPGWSVSGLIWSFQAGYACNWHPVTWWSHMLDCQLYGLNPGAHHLTNIVIHAANSVLLFLLLQRMTGATWRSAMVAALFAWHPMHVESVAWIAERKDVLSTFFWLLTLWAYTRYAENLKSRISSFAFFYSLALFFYALALMSKPMVVTLPCLLLLLDWWPLRRFQTPSFQEQGPAAALSDPGWGRLLTEKIPFFVMAGCCVVLTIVAQTRGTAIQSLGTVSLHFRMYNAVVSYWRYLGKLVVPVNLAVIYPIGPGHRSVLLAAGAGLLLVAVSATVLAFRLTRPYWFVGWFWYLGTLVPVIGLIQVGAQTMADRYTYVPSLGIFVILCWTAYDYAKNWRHGPLVLGWAAVLALGACAAVTMKQLQYWRNGGTLFAHAIAVTRDNYIAHGAYAEYLIGENKLEDARIECQRALDIWEGYWAGHFFQGVILYRNGAYDDAEKELEWALGQRWGAQRAQEYLGRIALARNSPIKAEVEFRKELQINPDVPSAHCELGKALALQGKREAARKEFEEALRLCAGYPEARGELRRLDSLK